MEMTQVEYNLSIVTLRNLRTRLSELCKEITRTREVVNDFAAEFTRLGADPKTLDYDLYRAGKLVGEVNQAVECRLSDGYALDPMCITESQQAVTNAGID